jgi:hypothetical protein
MSLPPYDQSIRDFERQYQVVLPDSVGMAAVGFRDGVWFRLNSGAPHPVPIRSAIIIAPHAAGSIVQIVCWWMREYSRTPRALDLATELALTVGELARKAVEEDPLGMSVGMTLTPQAPPPAPAPNAASQFATTSYNSGSYSSAPYADPYAPAAPASSYDPTYAAAPLAAATTILPQITPDMMPGGRPMNGAPRPAVPLSGLSPAMAPPPGRPNPGAPGMGAPRGPMPPNGHPQMGNSANWDRPGDPRSVRPAGGPPPRQNAPYDDPGPRGDYFRGEAPGPRRPERDDYRQDHSGRGPSRPPRQEPDQAW